MTPSRADQAEATRRAALAAARTLFLKQGYDATSLQAIADEMGVTKANVYYYFRTKAEILETLLRPMADALEALLDEAERIPERSARIDLLTAGFVDQVVAARRSLGPLNLGDPALRRDLAITRRLDALSQRGLRLVHGEHPTSDQAAGYWLAQDLGPVLRRLDGLGDDELRATLTRLCRRLLADEAGDAARRRPAGS
jgi:AcrR family transcriptional regulator